MRKIRNGGQYKTAPPIFSHSLACIIKMLNFTLNTINIYFCDIILLRLLYIDFIKITILFEVEENE